MELFSPAKINLFLRILFRRSDGFHEIASLFQAVSLYDTITFSHAEKDSFEIIDSSFLLPCDENNLILKALRLFRQKTHLNFPVAIRLKKQIPIEAGLGGGSSNAATTLFALNLLSGHQVEEKDLRRWGAEIGSDISFFFSSGSAYCTGRGEEVLSLPKLSQNKKFWLIKPQEGLPTPLIYKNLQLNRLSQKDPKSLLADFLQGSYSYINDLERPAFTLLPSLERLKDDLLKQGFNAVFLTGSGTGLICVGDNIPEVNFPIKCYPLSFLFREEGTWYLKKENIS